MIIETIVNLNFIVYCKEREKEKTLILLLCCVSNLKVSAA